MEEAKAVAKYIRIAPRKLRIVINLIRGKSVNAVLRSAAANAEHNFDMNVDNLVVSSAFVDQGPTMKRIHPRSRGQAFKILKRSSHVTVAVSEK